MGSESTNYNPLVKRAFDITVSGIALALLAPVLLGVAALVSVKLGRPVIFKQTRPGRNGKPFTILKFRTMTDERDDASQLLPDGQRLTPTGRFLRHSSLDELPTLWNVIRGDMSLVGPRPLIMPYLDRYTPEQAKRNLMRPGVTGLAQISGRNTLSWEDRFELDVQYVENWSFLTDLGILAMTVVKVFKREGITADDHASMPEFLGSIGQVDENPPRRRSRSEPE